MHANKDELPKVITSNYTTDGLTDAVIHQANSPKLTKNQQVPSNTNSRYYLLTFLRHKLKTQNSLT